MTSIIPGIVFVLAAGGGHARNLWTNNGDAALQPIVPQSRRTRICYELCKSGLGGASCGDSCFDLIPTNLPVSASGQDQNGENATASSNATTRQDSCDVLCKNGLGYPLCSCNDADQTQTETTNFFEICSVFCVTYNYQIYGCQNCTLYKDYMANKATVSGSFDLASLDLDGTVTVGWDVWCREVCTDGNGGAACNCELLP